MNTKQIAPCAVILAGGMGKRLRPLTETTPKPLLPVLGKPLLYHILQRLESMGVETAYLMTGYLSDRMESAVAAYGGRLKPICIKEETPMGSAGCLSLVEQAGQWQSCIVVSADAYFEFDLSGAWQMQKEKDAAAVLCLSAVEHPQGLGLVQCEKDGRITDFEEKPTWSKVRGNLANTGIYVLGKRAIDFILQRSAPLDFGKDVFSSLLERGEMLYGFASPGYWCDVGTVQAYRECNMRLSGGDSVLGRGVKLASTASLRESVLLDGVQVGAGATVWASVVAENAIIGQGVSIARDCVIGASAVIGDRCRIGRGVCIPGGTIVAARSVLQADLCMDDRGCFSEGKLILHSQTGWRSGNRAGRALAACAEEKKRVGLMRPSKKGKGEFWKGFAEGLLSGGCDVWDLGWGFEAKASFAARSLDLCYTALVDEYADRVEISLLDDNGLYPSGEFERRFSDFIRELPRAAEQQGQILLYKDLDKAYLSALCAVCEGVNLCGLEVKVDIASDSAQMLCDALAKCGAHTGERAQMHFWVSEDGRRAGLSVFGMKVDYWQLYTVLALEQVKKDGIVFLPHCCPEYIKKTVASAGGRAVFYSLYPSSDSEDHIRCRMTRQQPFVCDGLFAAMRFAALICKGSLGASYLADVCRSVAVREEDVFLCEKEKLKAVLSHRREFDGEGMCCRYKQGAVRLRACADGRVHLMAEAAEDADAKWLVEKIKREISPSDA